MVLSVLCVHLKISSTSGCELGSLKAAEKRGKETNTEIEENPGEPQAKEDSEMIVRKEGRRRRVKQMRRDGAG